MDCVFCRIIQGELPAQIIAEYPTAIVIADRAPQAPIHWLVIPRIHVTDLRDQQATADQTLLTGLIAAVHTVVHEQGAGRPFKLVINNGAEAGQRVFHLHAHILIGSPSAAV